MHLPSHTHSIGQSRSFTLPVLASQNRRLFLSQSFTCTAIHTEFDIVMHLSVTLIHFPLHDSHTLSRLLICPITPTLLPFCLDIHLPYDTNLSILQSLIHRQMRTKRNSKDGRPKDGPANFTMRITIITESTASIQTLKAESLPPG